MRIYFETDEERGVVLCQFLQEGEGFAFGQKLNALGQHWKLIEHGGDRMGAFLIMADKFAALKNANQRSGGLFFSGLHTSAGNNFEIDANTFEAVIQGTGKEPNANIFSLKTTPGPKGKASGADPAEELNRLTLAKMAEGMSFQDAFKAAQIENPQAARAVADYLDEFRRATAG